MRGVLSLGLNLIFTNLYFVGTNLDLIVTMILYLDFEGKSLAQNPDLRLYLKNQSKGAWIYGHKTIPHRL